MSPTVEITKPQLSDLGQISRLHARVFGPGRFARTAYRIREGTQPISSFCRIARIDDMIIASIRFSPIVIGGRKDALLLGPLVVAPDHAGLGHGRRLIREGIAAAKAAGLKLVVLVGDSPYYGPLGFRTVPPGSILFPGPVDPDRILACELEPGALSLYSGPIIADTGSDEAMA